MRSRHDHLISISSFDVYVEKIIKALGLQNCSVFLSILLDYIVLLDYNFFSLAICGYFVI